MSQLANDPATAEHPPAPPRRRSRRAQLALALLGTCAALVAAEFGVRAFFPGADGFYEYPPGLRRTFLPAVELLPGLTERVHFDVNSLGLRGDEAPPGAAYRILAVGGSTTQCAYVDQPDSWPMRVQALLEEACAERGSGPPVWVANAGRSGFTSRRHVVQLRHLLEQGPHFDAVLLLVGVNDLANRLKSGDQEPPLEDMTWEGVSTAECFTFVPTEADDRDPFLKRLGLFRAAKVLEVRASMPAEERVGQEYVKWRANRRGASEIRAELPDLSRALEAYRHNLAECAAIAREHGARLILIDQPSLWRADLPEKVHRLLWLGGVGDYQHERGLPYYSIPALAEGMQRYNDTLHELAADAGLESIHLAEQVPKDPRHFYDDVHFNVQGSRAVGAAIAGYLLDRPPFSD